MKFIRPGPAWVPRKLPEPPAEIREEMLRKDRELNEAAQHFRCAKLAREIYEECWDETDVVLGRFVDPVLELQARAVRIDDEAFIVFRGSFGKPLLSTNWIKVNFDFKLNSE